MLWRASSKSIEDSVRNAIHLATKLKLESMAFPIIGAGSGGFNETKALAIMESTLGELHANVAVTVVRFR
jgi:O-acetyl-ADP-ribose deacetylase